MELSLTITQRQRLLELDAGEEIKGIVFSSEAQRDQTFKEIHHQLVSRNKLRLQKLRNQTLRPALRRIESLLVKGLNEFGFVEVVTPTLLTKGMLAKMGIGPNHPLIKQVYWVEEKTCLRPMLAPNLYYLLGRLFKAWANPIRIFEVGSCFRKESAGSKHLEEFTMLNLVEMGFPEDSQTRLLEIITQVMGVLEVPYQVQTELSEVYGKTTDILVDDIEIASGAVGPHPLDQNWKIADNWAGLGLGLERIVMIKEGYNNIRRAGRSLIYLDGARLNI